MFMMDLIAIANRWYVSSCLIIGGYASSSRRLLAFSASAVREIPNSFAAFVSSPRVSPRAPGRVPRPRARQACVPTARTASSSGASGSGARIASRAAPAAPPLEGQDPERRAREDENDPCGSLSVMIMTRFICLTIRCMSCVPVHAACPPGDRAPRRRQPNPHRFPMTIGPPALTRAAPRLPPSRPFAA